MSGLLDGEYRSQKTGTKLVQVQTYLENYISEDEADRLVQEIDAAPWRADLKRRVQHYGYYYDYKARQARREDYLGPLPELFQQLAERLTIEGYFQLVPDQTIVNEYQP